MTVCGKPMRRNIVKVNLGCGTRALPDWINIDIDPNIVLSRLPELKRVMYKLRLIHKVTYETTYLTYVRRWDVRKGLPFSNQSVDYIYTSHMLEHLTDHEAKDVLKECYRVLKPGGHIRIIVPDLEFLVQRYIERDCEYYNVDTDGFIAKKFVEALNLHSQRPTLNPIKILHRYFAQYGNHFAAFDFYYLRAVLFTQGFTDIKRRSLKQGVVPDIEFLDKPDRRERDSLVVEAKKP